MAYRDGNDDISALFLRDCDSPLLADSAMASTINDWQPPLSLPWKVLELQLARWLRIHGLHQRKGTAMGSH